MAVQDRVAKMSSDRSTFSNFMTSAAVTKKVNSMIGGKAGQRFISSIVSAVAATPQLQKCNFDTLLSGALLGESLKLSPSPQLGQYYLVPFGSNAQFILGYKGMIQLAIRSGMYKKLNVLSIKEGELIRYDPLNEEIEVNLIDDEVQRENAETIGYYAMFEYTNGFRKSLYWSKEKMKNHGKTYSKSFDKSSSFWQKDFDVMAYKTMLRQLISKWGIMSIDMQIAYESDMAVIKEDGSKEYIDNPNNAVVEVSPAFNNQISETTSTPTVENIVNQAQPEPEPVLEDIDPMQM